MRNLFKLFKEDEPELLNALDLNVYTPYRWFRLPNQTLGSKPFLHHIIEGEMKHFILSHIDETSDALTFNNNDRQVDEIIKLTPIKNQIKKVFHYDASIQYQIKDVEIIELLDQLPSEYLDDYDKWSIITNMLKGLNKKEIWDKWSSTSDRYNQFKNNNMWRNAKKIKFDINYVVNVINQSREKDEKIKHIDTYKEFKPITKNIIAEKFNDYRVSNIYTFDDFKKNKTVIIQSCTGTGKTTMVAKHFEKYISGNKDRKHIKLLSIIDKITLSHQHLKSFKDYNIKVQSYQEGFKKNNHFCVCINSLLQLENLSNLELSQYFVYIDEINSFLQLTHNKTLDSNIRAIFNLLMRIIKNAHKVIVSDNLITDNVFELLRCRGDYKYIVNEYKKFEGVEAIRVRDQPMFLDMLKEHIANDKYFLYGCDSCTIVEQLYIECLKEVKEADKDKFLIITVNNKLEIKNASEQFKNKFVFFSPSITTGVDFSIDEKQDVFIYLHGQSIDPSQAFQQTTRCRNINKLFYYSESNSYEPNYKSVEEIEKTYTEFIETSDRLNEVCKTINEDYDEVMGQNDFFKLYCYNDYTIDTFRTNKTIHYENILRDAKFKIMDDELNPFSTGPISLIRAVSGPQAS